AFLEDCASEARVALRAIILGALHGPKQKTIPGYYSNQSPRTYAPKPDYAVRFWQARGLRPAQVDVMTVIGRRARRFFEPPAPRVSGEVRLADSRDADSLRPGGYRIKWVITSPPYYGMRTYIPDQWLRGWFLGGPDTVDYSARGQIAHDSPETFAADLRQVWRNAEEVCAEDAKMVIRFGGIRDRRANPLDLIKSSLSDSGWRITAIREAGTAAEGKRQADTFLQKASRPVMEYDVWAMLG
ncbi:MAG: hypothetical protein ACK4Q4_06565, partial [Rhodocyclaceae bacterium]